MSLFSANLLAASKFNCLPSNTSASNSAAIDVSIFNKLSAIDSNELNSTPAFAACTANLPIDSADPSVIDANTVAFCAIDANTFDGLTLLACARACTVTNCADAPSRDTSVTSDII